MDITPVIILYKEFSMKCCFQVCCNFADSWHQKTFRDQYLFCIEPPQKIYCEHKMTLRISIRLTWLFKAKQSCCL